MQRDNYFVLSICANKKLRKRRSNITRTTQQVAVPTQEYENKNAPSNIILPYCKMCCAARDDVGLYPIN